MIYLSIFLILFLVMGFLSAQAGYSMTFQNNKWQKWQAFATWGGKVPEIVLGAVVGAVALVGFDYRFNLVEKFTTAFPIDGIDMLLMAFSVFFVIYLFVSFVSFVGKESATVYQLIGNWWGWTKDTNNDGVINEDDLRNNTMRKINDPIARLLRVDKMGKWYPKIWCTTKGFLVSIPLGGLVALFNAISRHVWITVGLFMNRRHKHDANFYAEGGGDGMALALGITLFAYLIFNF